MEVLDPKEKEPIVQENSFLQAERKEIKLPTYEASADRLPRPFWDGHSETTSCFDKVWQIAFNNVMNPAEGSGFVSPFIDTAFNGCLFLWDSSFILMFARYGSRAHNFQQTLDNFYSHQHIDGFISREIFEADGMERFPWMNYASTGPNVLAWCEWEYYLNFGDRDRLHRVFPALLGYHRWMRKYRGWPDGSYWSTGLGCGMDNSPRCQPGFDHLLHHSYMSWIDATAQGLLSAECLRKIAAEIGREADTADLQAEAEKLRNYINEKMWNEELGTYADRYGDGSISDVVHIGAYWAILAGAATPERAERMLDLLEDPKHYNRPHRVPTLSASHPEYSAQGEYWKGSIWAPTNYMVLRGLRLLGTPRALKLAHEIGQNHNQNAVKVFQETGTVWENYAPESITRGNISKKDFVGWSGLGPVAVLLEEVFGLQPSVPENKLRWEVHLCEEFGVERYPFGKDGLFDLRAKARANPAEKPQVEISGNLPLQIELVWAGGAEAIQYRP